MGTTKKSGFTILELVIVIAVIAVLAGVAIFERNQAAKSTEASPTPSTVVSSATPAESSVSVATDAPTATPDPTADWITYNSSQYKFSLKHPSDWNETEGVTSATDVSFSFEKVFPNNQETQKIPYYVSVEVISSTQSASDYAAGLKTVDIKTVVEGGPAAHYGYTESNVTVGDNTFLLWSNVSTLAAVSDYYFTSNNTSVYVIRVMKTPGEGTSYDTTSYQQIARQILQTLVITK